MNLYATSVADLDGIQQSVYYMLQIEPPGASLVDDVLYITNTDANIMTSIYHIFAPIGIALLILYFVIDLMEQSTTSAAGGGITLQQFGKSFIMLIIGYFLLDKGGELISLICDFGNAATRELSAMVIDITPGDATAIDPNNDPLAEVLKKMNYLQLMTIMGMSNFTFLISIGTSLFITMHAVTRRLEVILRGGLAPLSLPDVFCGLKQSGCLRFMKKLTALLLHGGVMVLVIKVGEAINRSNAIDVFSDGFQMSDLITWLAPLAYTFAIIGMLSASKSVVNDALGV